MCRWRIAAVLVLAVAVLLAAACEQKQSAARRDQPSEGARPEATGAATVTAYEGTIAAVGDSLTAGYGVSEKDAYPARLERQLISDGYRYKVVNAGNSGETTSGTFLESTGCSS